MKKRACEISSCGNTTCGTVEDRTLVVDDESDGEKLLKKTVHCLIKLFPKMKIPSLDLKI